MNIIELTSHLNETARRTTAAVLEVLSERNQLDTQNSTLRAELLGYEAILDSLNKSFGCEHKGPEDGMNLVRHVDEALEENRKLKAMLAYVAYLRLDSLGRVVFEQLDETRQRAITAMLEPSTKSEIVKILGEEPIERETCAHDWKPEGADRDGNWVSTCRKCGAVLE